MSPVCVRDLENQVWVWVTGPSPILLCDSCGETNSANPLDYWDVIPAHVFTHCGKPMRLVQKKVVFVDVEYWYVYILENKSKTKLYTGIAKDVQARLAEHNGAGGAKATRAGRPWYVAYTRLFEGKSEAMKHEAHIKKLPRSAKLRLIQAEKKGD